MSRANFDLLGCGKAFNNFIYDGWSPMIRSKSDLKSDYTPNPAAAALRLRSPRLGVKGWGLMGMGSQIAKWVDGAMVIRPLKCTNCHAGVCRADLLSIWPKWE
jgi:hypothetical protein